VSTNERLRLRLEHLAGRLNNRKDLVQKYLSILGRVDPDAAREVRIDDALISEVLIDAYGLTGMENAPDRGVWDEDQGKPEKDILYTVQLRCYLHKGNWFKAYAVKTSHLLMHQNDFGVAKAYRGIDGFDLVDHRLFDAITCPFCYYSSNSKNDFIIKSSTDRDGLQKREVGKKLINALMEMTVLQERKLLFQARGRNYFSRRRTLDDAVTGYLSIIQTAQVEHRHGQPTALYRAASAALNVAQIYFDVQNAEWEDRYLNEALTLYRKIYEDDVLPGNHPMVWKQILALALRLENIDLARETLRQINQEYTGRKVAFDKLKNQWTRTSRSRRADDSILFERMEGEKKAFSMMKRYYEQSRLIWDRYEAGAIPTLAFPDPAPEEEAPVETDETPEEGAPEESTD
jgi:uncharacterized protein (DUF2225 family)